VTRFEVGEKNREIAAALRVSERSVEGWRRLWRERGHAGVASKGSPGRPRLSEAQVAGLERELERGPLAHGWADQRWTLARVKMLIVIRARTQLGSPIVLVWDNLRMHLVAPLREFFEAGTDWLTVFPLPTYAPDLNPQEGIWSLVKRDIGNLAAAGLGQVTRAVKRKLKRLQYRTEVIDGCLAGTGLILNT
jgi:transposase